VRKNKGDSKIIKDFFRYEYLLDYSLTRIKPILVSMWNGYVMGGGVGVSIHAPIRIATDNTLFAMPESGIGFFPDVGASYFLPRIFNKDPTIGLYMGLTGEKIKGRDIAKCGVATHFVPQEKMEKLKTAIIEKSGEDATLKHVQSIVQEFAEITYNPEHFSFPRSDDIQRTFLVDNIDALLDRLHNTIENGSEDEKGWASNVLKIIEKSSPISIVVAFEQIKRGIAMKTVDESYNLEAQLCAAFVEDSDFFEGVRALLVDKDQKPNWKYNSIKDINQKELINKYFDRSEEINVSPEADNEKLENEK